MLNLLRQESYKMYKSNAFRGWTIVLVLWQVLLAITTKKGWTSSPQTYVATFGDFTFIGSLIMIILASTIITKEFAQGTIKNLLDRQYTRFQVFISKMFTLIWVYVFMLAIAIVLTFVMKLILFNSTQFPSSFGKIFGLFIGGDAIYTFLLIGAVMLISTIAKKSSGAAIGIGVVFIFASQLISGISMLLISVHQWIRWNPFTFLLVNDQVNSTGMSQITKLNTPTIVIGALIYGLIFYAIAEWIFEKRNI